jgi:hypothetical protein
VSFFFPHQHSAMPSRRIVILYVGWSSIKFFICSHIMIACRWSINKNNLLCSSLYGLELDFRSPGHENVAMLVDDSALRCLESEKILVASKIGNLHSDLFTSTASVNKKSTRCTKKTQTSHKLFVFFVRTEIITTRKEQ